MKIASETRVNTDGLMRCCTGTLDKIAIETPDREFNNGDTIQCMYTDNTSHNMVLENGIWKWNWPTASGQAVT